MTRQRDGRDVHHLGQILLLHAVAPAQMGQHGPLRPGQPEMGGLAVETPAQQAGDIVDGEAEALVEVFVHDGAYSKPAYHKQAGVV